MVLPGTGAERAARNGVSRVKTIRSEQQINGSIVVNVPVAMKRTTIALPVAILADSVVSAKKRNNLPFNKKAILFGRGKFQPF